MVAFCPRILLTKFQLQIQLQLDLIKNVRRNVLHNMIPARIQDFNSVSGEGWGLILKTQRSSPANLTIFIILFVAVYRITITYNAIPRLCC